MRFLPPCFPFGNAGNFQYQPQRFVCRPLRRLGLNQVAWISALERSEADPTVEMLRRLLVCMGEELVLEVRRLPGHAAHDPVGFQRAREASMSERLEEADSWSELASTLAPRR